MTATSIPDWVADLSKQENLFGHVFDPHKDKVARVELISHQGDVIPAIFMRQPKGAFRSRLSNSTRAKILMDVVTLLPFPTPFAFVMPVLFDDPRNPFWTIVFLNLFPNTSLGGIPLLTHSEADLPESRALVRAFCHQRSRCGLVVFEDSDLLVRRIVPFAPLEEGRIDEIGQVMDFLDGRSIFKDHLEFQRATEIFSETCAFQIKDSEDDALVIPRMRSLIQAHDTIYSVCVDHDRLIDRRAVLARSEVLEPKYDLFISYAHTDVDAARNLSIWLKKHWPDIIVEYSDPNDRQRFSDDPSYFLDTAHASRAILYLVTENSLERPMVDTELGVNAYKPIISVLLGTATKNQLRQKMRDNLFISIDFSKVVDFRIPHGPEKMIQLLSEILTLPLPTVITAFSPVSIVKDDSDPLLRRQSYPHDEQRIRGRVKSRQTVEQADALVKSILSERLEVEGQSGMELPPTPYKRLLILLSSMKHEEEWKTALDCVPALLNQGLLVEIDLLHRSFKEAGEIEIADKLSRLRPLVERLVQDAE